MASTDCIATNGQPTISAILNKMQNTQFPSSCKTKLVWSCMRLDHRHQWSSIEEPTKQRPKRRVKRFSRISVHDQPACLEGKSNNSSSEDAQQFMYTASRLSFKSTTERTIVHDNAIDLQISVLEPANNLLKTYVETDCKGQLQLATCIPELTQVVESLHFNSFF